MSDPKQPRPRVTKVRVRVSPIQSDDVRFAIIELDTENPVTKENFNFYPQLIISDFIQFQIYGLREFPEVSIDGKIVFYKIYGVIFSNPSLNQIKIQLEPNEIPYECDFEYLED